MFTLKQLSKEAIPEALKKVERYRLLNEPAEAESICRDVLAADPQNQEALIGLILSLSDQLGKGADAQFSHVRDLVPQLKNEYHREYYLGILCERQAKAKLDQDSPGTDFDAYEWFRRAMSHFEKSEGLRPAGDDSALLRWNTCARIVTEKKLRAQEDDKLEPYLE